MVGSQGWKIFGGSWILAVRRRRNGSFVAQTGVVRRYGAPLLYHPFFQNLMHQRLATAEALKKNGWHLASICCFCKKQQETDNHLFVNCPIADWLWNVLGLKLCKHYVNKRTVEHLMAWFNSEFKGKGLCTTIAKVAFGAGIYFLWNTRNNIIFNQGTLSKMKLLKTIEQQVKLNLDGRGAVSKDNDVGPNREIAERWGITFLCKW